MKLQPSRGSRAVSQIENCAACYHWQQGLCKADDGCNFISRESITRGRDRKFRAWVEKNCPQALTLIAVGRLSYLQVHLLGENLGEGQLRPYAFNKSVFFPKDTDSAAPELESAAWVRSPEPMIFTIQDYLDYNLEALDGEMWLALRLSEVYADPRTKGRTAGSSFRKNLMGVVKNYYLITGGEMPPVINLDREYFRLEQRSDKRRVRPEHPVVQLSEQSSPAYYAEIYDSEYNSTVKKYEAVLRRQDEGQRYILELELAQNLYRIASNFQSKTGHPFGNSPYLSTLSLYQIENISSMWDWSTYKKLVNLFSTENKSMAEELAARTVGVFGIRSRDWLNSQKSRGFSPHDASYWLPIAPSEPGLAEFLFRNSKSELTELALVIGEWDKKEFPREASLKEMLLFIRGRQALEITEGLADKGFKPDLRKEIGLIAARYNLSTYQIVDGSQAVAPALTGKVIIDPRLVGSWEIGDYTLRFLSKTDPLGMALGSATNCCQGWGLAGQSCMVAGYNSPASGFLVAFERGKNLKIAAQAWVWLDAEGTGRNEKGQYVPIAESLVLDNIEIPHQNSVSEKILELYKVWAALYNEKTGLGVKLGTGCAEYSLAKLEKCTEPSSIGKVFSVKPYTDARNQVWLARPGVLDDNITAASKPILARLATEAHEFEQVRQLEKLCYPVGLQTGLDELEDEGTYTFVVIANNAEDYQKEGKIIGYIVAELENEGVYVADLAVHPDYRKIAVSPLLALFRQVLHEQGLNQISADLRENTSYRMLMQRGLELGFRISQVLREEIRGGEKFLNCVIEVMITPPT